MTVAEALARVAQGCGVKVVTHVPGFGASETFAAWQELSPCPASLHEEVAFGVAHGAALTGAPAVCLVKMHGLLKAANALVDALLMGVSAGFVTVVFEDPKGRHSDGIVPTTAILDALEVPFEWASDPRALGEALHASQSQGLPRVLVVESERVKDDYSGPVNARALREAEWVADPVGQMACPLFGEYQRSVLLARLGHAPPPPPPVLPSVDGLPPHWQPTLATYRVWMEAACRGGRPPFVAGDTGLASLLGLEPVRAVDCIGWMGGSLPLALGALAGGLPEAWAVTGDFSFAAAGFLGWLEALQRGLPLRVLLFDNGCAQATGGQPVDGGLLARLLTGPEVVRVERPEELAVDRAAAGPRLYWLKVD